VIGICESQLNDLNAIDDPSPGTALDGATEPGIGPTV
jgi:hypothetical protein